MTATELLKTSPSRALLSFRITAGCILAAFAVFSYTVSFFVGVVRTWPGSPVDSTPPDSIAVSFRVLNAAIADPHLQLPPNARAIIASRAKDLVAAAAAQQQAARARDLAIRQLGCSGWILLATASWAGGWHIIGAALRRLRSLPKFPLAA